VSYVRIHSFNARKSRVTFRYAMRTPWIAYRGCSSSATARAQYLAAGIPLAFIRSIMISQSNHAFIRRAISKIIRRIL